MTDTIQTFDTKINVTQALLWQYDQAARLQALLEEKQVWYDANHTQFWDDWYTDVFDLRTANDFGLSVWAIILGQPIIFPNVANPDKATWGFGEFHKNFTRGNFASGSGFTYRLSTATARSLLRLRYYQLTSSGTVPETNRMLADVFADDGPCVLRDNHNMTQTYVFGFYPKSDMLFLLRNFDILPRPSGVKSDFQIIIDDTWGFGPNHENFDHGNFSEG